MAGPFDHRPDLPFRAAGAGPLGKALASSRTSRELSQGVAVLDRSLIFLQGNVSPGAVCGDLVWQLQ